MDTNYGDWQYLAFPFVAKHDYTNIRIYASYSYNANKADFADFHVYKDDFGASFTYDSKGNVISVKDKSAQETAFQYDDYNNLNQVTNSDGGLYKYTYTEGDVKNLLTATSAEGIKYSYEYTPGGTGRVVKNTIVGTDANGNEVTDKIISNILAYTNNDNYTATKEDSKGYTTTNTWDTSLGRLTSVSDNAGGQVSYGYDNNTGRVTQTTTKMNATQDVINQSVFTADKLTQIIHNGFSYNFTYDSFGHRTGTAVGSTTLVSDTYNNQTHLLTSSTYGNGTTFEPVYDSDHKLVGKKYDGTLAYEYTYSKQGELLGVKDNVNNTQSSFLYDLIGRLVKSKDSQGNSWTYGYDEFNNMNSISKSQYGVSEKESITFDLDNKVTSFTLSQGTAEKLKQSVTYDKLGRMTTVGTALNGSTTQSPFLAKGYEFMQGDGGAGTTTALVSKETVGGTARNYTYDAKGNILSISSSAGVITYTYDLISQLTKEVNGITGETIDYVYDTGGNILSKTITKDGVSRTTNYGYNDTNWKDKLTSFDGQNILYDPIGNPLSLNGATLGWTQGRKLSTYTKGGTTAYYTYDENGIRKSKYVNGTTTEYLTSGGEVVAQKTGTNVTTYTRGADGSLISMNRNGVVYYYQTNLQGDVEKILDGNGTAVVSYTYDAYGRLTSMTGDQTLGQENPFRYRSYFFDQESGFYYLQSRYYDPMMGRFISADSQINPDVNGGNVFAYCSNNPVNAVDKDGHAFMFIAAAIGAVVGAVIGAVVTKSWQGALAGAAIGGLIGLTCGAAAGLALAGSATASTAAVLGNASLALVGTGSAIGLGASKSIDKIANGYQKAKSLLTGATDIYRSISTAELNNILKTRQFNLQTGAMEAKQFGFSYSEVAKFGQSFHQNGIVRATIPNSMLNYFDSTAVDSFLFKSGTLTVWGDKIEQFNNIVSSSIKIMP